MFTRLVQATAITLALYGLLGLDGLQTTTAEGETPDVIMETPEVIVALRQALTKRQ